ncbi:hypothetical protein [Dyadobacter sp. Leaf189]|uniref:hypothetical protein n=1 Tax=Dyadobacter sp. Leaf189 TaxID=1736295 RepID=UPI0006F5F476|nr:hypothetical protein [Dyadobacter sp. Leaf189]KQS27956.1 hypothetical protein ASG33_16275 [Dyadobacter sp. Leaf189]
MKSPDDHIDDELRNALRNRFDDFELQPGTELKKNIFAQLRTWQHEQAFQRTLIASLLFAILFTGTLFYSSKQGIGGRAVAAKATAVKEKAAATGKAVRTLAKVEVPNASKVNAGTEPLAAVKKETVQASLRIIREKLTVSNEDKEQNVEGAESKLVEPATASNTFNDVSQITDNQFVAKSDDNENLGERLQITDISYLNSLPAHWNSPALAITDSVAYFEAASGKRPKTGTEWTLLAGVTPVQSFQILNILPNQGQLYRNFQFPRSASFESLGYKLNAGVEKNGLQFLVSYGHYRQSVSYEVAGNEFEIVPNGSNAEARRKYATVSSGRTLNLVGLGIRKQLVPRAPALRAFYAVAGAEFTREFTEGKNIVWANAGIGRQVRVGRNTALHIGPYFEYGFTKLLNAEGSFQVKPYQVGLSIVLRNKLVR